MTKKIQCSKGGATFCLVIFLFLTAVVTFFESSSTLNAEDNRDDFIKNTLLASFLSLLTVLNDGTLFGPEFKKNLMNKDEPDPLPFLISEGDAPAPTTTPSLSSIRYWLIRTIPPLSIVPALASEYFQKRMEVYALNQFLMSNGCNISGISSVKTTWLWFFATGGVPFTAACQGGAAYELAEQKFPAAFENDPTWVRKRLNSINDHYECGCLTFFKNAFLFWAQKMGSFFHALEEVIALPLALPTSWIKYLLDGFLLKDPLKTVCAISLSGFLVVSLIEMYWVTVYFEGRKVRAFFCTDLNDTHQEITPSKQATARRVLAFLPLSILYHGLTDAIGMLFIPKEVLPGINDEALTILRWTLFTLAFFGFGSVSWLSEYKGAHEAIIDYFQLEDRQSNDGENMENGEFAGVPYENLDKRNNTICQRMVGLFSCCTRQRNTPSSLSVEEEEEEFDDNTLRKNTGGSTNSDSLLTHTPHKTNSGGVPSS